MKLNLGTSAAAPSERVLGIHVDWDALRLVTVHRGSIDGWRVLPYPGGQRPSGDALISFLQGALAQTGLPPWHRVWAICSPPSLQIRFLTLPRARPAQLSSMVYWTFRKEIPFDASQTSFNFDVEGDMPGDPQKRLAITAYTVNRTEVEQLRHALERARTAPTGILLPNFALRNLLRSGCMGHPKGTSLLLYVGEESSSLMVLSHGVVALSRVFQTGLNALVAAAREHWPALSALEAERRVVELGRAESVDAGGERRRILGPAIGRLAQQVERSMSAFLAGRANDEIGTLYIAGTMADLPNVVEELGAQIGIKTAVVQPMDPTRLSSGLAPPDAREACRMSVALGAALSTEAETPSLLRSFTEREKERRAAQLGLVASIACIVALLLCTAAFGWLRAQNRRVNAELRQLRAEWAAFAPHPTQELISALSKQVRERHARERMQAREYLPVALVSEVAALTPVDIRLDGIQGTIGLPPAPGRTDRAASAEATKVRVSGRVSGPWGTHESKLAAYVLRLGDSPLFDQVKVLKSEPATDGGEPVLAFELEWELQRDAAPDPVVAASAGGAS